MKNTKFFRKQRYSFGRVNVHIRMRIKKKKQKKKCIKDTCLEVVVVVPNRPTTQNEEEGSLVDCFIHPQKQYSIKRHVHDFYARPKLYLYFRKNFVFFIKKSMPIQQSKCAEETWKTYGIGFFNSFFKKIKQEINKNSQTGEREYKKQDLLKGFGNKQQLISAQVCLLYTSPSPRDLSTSRMPSSA